MESPELLALCLKRIPALQDDKYISNNNNNNVSNIQVTDALWVWTEPNCMRLKVRITVRATVGESQNTVIQQRCLVTFVIRFKQCPECNREYTNRTWHALVQVRQKSTNKSNNSQRGLHMLEMVITKHPKIGSNIIGSDTVRQGFDFYFLSLHHAQQFTNFLQKIMPIKVNASTKKLISSDSTNNTANFKHTILCHLVPLCRYDLIIIGGDNNRKAKKIIGNCFSNNTCNIRLGLVMKVSKCIRLLDATYHNGVVVNDDINDLCVDLHADNYWKCDKFLKVISSQRNCIPFIVLDIEPLSQDNRNDSDKNSFIEVEVARESDFGVNDITLRCVSHLGHLLNVGDTVLGYDLTTMVLPSDDETFYQTNTFDLPDVVLLKKSKGVQNNNDDNKKQSNSQKQLNSGAHNNKSLKRKDKRKKKKHEKERTRSQYSEPIRNPVDGKETIMEEEKEGIGMEEEKKLFQLELEEDSDIENELHDYLETYEASGKGLINDDSGGKEGSEDNIASMMEDIDITSSEEKLSLDAHENNNRSVNSMDESE